MKGGDENQDGSFSISTDWDCLAEPLFIFDSSSICRGINLAARELLGYDIGMMNQVTPGVLVHADDRPLVRAAISAAIAGTPTKIQCRVSNIDRDWRWIETSFACRAELIYALSRDVTERRQEEMLAKAEAEILKSIATGAELNETLSRICAAAEDAIRDSFCVIYLIDRDGKPRPAAIGPNAPKELRAALETASQSGEAAGLPGLDDTIGFAERKKSVAERCEQILLRHKAMPHWSKTVASRSGEPIGLFTVYRQRQGEASGRDTGIVDRFANSAAIAIERRQMDRALIEARNNAEAASRAKSEFVANMSHELRTPLNAIIGFSDLIHAEVYGSAGNARYKEYAGDIHRAGKHLLSLINDVLDVARVEGGRLTIEREPVAIGEMLRETLRHVERAFPNRGEIRIDGQIREGILADHRAMTQILLNILSNAVKFTPTDGSITIRVDSEAPGLRIIVRDNGVGIAADNLRRIGQPFFQADTPLRREYAGTGLGLFISRSLMIAHGGTLKIDSEVNAGTTVSLGFPEEYVIRDGEDMAAPEIAPSAPIALPS